MAIYVRGGSRIFRTLVKHFVAEHWWRGPLLTGGGGTFDGGGGGAKQINIFMCSVYENM